MRREAPAVPLHWESDPGEKLTVRDICTELKKIAWSAFYD
jgi:hypothetical protein